MKRKYSKLGLQTVKVLKIIDASKIKGKEDDEINTIEGIINTLIILYFQLLIITY